MLLYDISVSLNNELPLYPGDPPLSFESSLPPGAVTRMSFGSHSGTHIDLPGHFDLPGLNAGQLSLEELVGPCLVLDLTGHSGPIHRDILMEKPLDGHTRLLLKTANSAFWREKQFSRDFQALTLDGAAWLIEQGVRLIGIDYLSIEGWESDGQVHRQLLREGVIILEGLDLARVTADCYELICLPLKVPLLDGAPCRAVLRQG